MFYRLEVPHIMESRTRREREREKDFGTPRGEEELLLFSRSSKMLPLSSK
jgi:hypothetical protein